MNRRTIAASALALALTGGLTVVGWACTGFAVYSGKTLFGMNFDYPPNEVRFSIEEHDVGAVFFGSFWMDEHYAHTVGMNAVSYTHLTLPTN